MENSFKMYYDEFIMNFNSYNEKEKTAIKVLLDLYKGCRQEMRDAFPEMDQVEEISDIYVDLLTKPSTVKVLEAAENSVILDASYALEDFIFELVNFYYDKLPITDSAAISNVVYELIGDKKKLNSGSFYYETENDEVEFFLNAKFIKKLNDSELLFKSIGPSRKTLVINIDNMTITLDDKTFDLVGNKILNLNKENI